MSNLTVARAAEDAVDISDNQKLVDLDQDTVDINAEGSMTTDAGNDILPKDQRPCDSSSRLLISLDALEKIQHLNHERIPERAIYARGTGAFGTFQLLESAEDVTQANVLCDTTRTTPVFARFSNLTGSTGSSDTQRDVRGFAVKMYTAEGNWDLLTQNIPVCAVRDGEDFADFVHALKPEPHTGLSYGHLGHNNFWDFVNCRPESIHMALWLMSDHGIPRSYRMMNGFGVNTFTLINEHGNQHYVRFQWVPALGTRSLHPSEAMKLAGYDPDYYRRDLRESIANECYPKWHLGIQIIRKETAGDMSFDVLDATCIWPQDKVPLRLIGVLELNHNIDEIFTQVEQVTFRPTNLVPGVALSPDPLLQHRAAAYADAQSRRLGVNAAELPINRFMHVHRVPAYFQDLPRAVVKIFCVVMKEPAERLHSI
ncbi:hypothetical protein BBP40_002603 [Aspergillus hancockii]|nr:hypothetical protein BBP40_002603 [Aspergillus hancockii]